MPSRRLPPTVPAPALLALLLVLTACGGGERGDASGPTASGATPSVSTTADLATVLPTATPTPTPTVVVPDGPPARTPPPLPSEAGRDDRAGREAFARHVVDLWVHALATNDTGPLTALAPRGGCEGCAALDRELRQRTADGWYVAIEQVAVAAVDGPRRAPRGEPVRLVATVDIPATYALNDDGTFRTSSPSHDDATFEVDLAWRGGRFVLLGYAVLT